MWRRGETRKIFFHKQVQIRFRGKQGIITLNAEMIQQSKTLYGGGLSDLELENNKGSVLEGPQVRNQVTLNEKKWYDLRVIC